MPVDYLDQIAVFETLRIYRGAIFCFAEHFDRLTESCKGIGRNVPFSREDFYGWIREALKESGLENAVLRASVHWAEGGAGQLVMIFREFETHPEEWYERGIELKTALPKRWTLRAQNPQIKSSQFMSGVLAHVDLIRVPEGSDPSGTGGQRGQTPLAPAGEFLFLNEWGLVAEGSVSNLFMVKEKRLLTPPLASGILKGVTRGFTMRLAQNLGLEVLETPLTRHDLYNADECFMTNTSSEILAVVRIDARKIGGGRPGSWTRQLAAAFKNDMPKFLE